MPELNRQDGPCGILLALALAWVTLLRFGFLCTTHTSPQVTFSLIAWLFCGGLSVCTHLRHRVPGVKMTWPYMVSLSRYRQEGLKFCSGSCNPFWDKCGWKGSDMMMYAFRVSMTLPPVAPAPAGTFLFFVSNWASICLMAPASLGSKSYTKSCSFLIFQIHICWSEISQNSTSILNRGAGDCCISLEHHYSHPDFNHWSSAYPTSVWSILAFNHLASPPGGLPWPLDWAKYFSSLLLENPCLSLLWHFCNTPH